MANEVHNRRTIDLLRKDVRLANIERNHFIDEIEEVLHEVARLEDAATKLRKRAEKLLESYPKIVD